MYMLHSVTLYVENNLQPVNSLKSFLAVVVIVLLDVSLVTHKRKKKPFFKHLHGHYSDELPELLIPSYCLRFCNQNTVHVLHHLHVTRTNAPNS